MASARYLARVSSVLPLVHARGFDWYVDSVHGSDSNNGKSRSQAFQTIARLESVFQAGQSVGLGRGSHWREELNLPGAGCTVAAYGSGERPILDGSNLIPAGSWTKTAGRANAYQVNVTPEWYGSGKDWLNVFEDDWYLQRAADLAACDSTPGSYYPSGSSGAITLYIHATGSTNPNTNGRTYEYTHRKYGLDAYSYANCRITGIHTMKSLHNDGSLRGGIHSTLVDCKASLGSLHNIYVRTGSKLVGCVAQDGYAGATNLTLFVGNDNSPNNEGLTFVNCQAISSSFDAHAVGFYCHRNVSGSFGVVVYQGCSAVNCNNGFHADHVSQVNVSNVTLTACNYGFRIGAYSWNIAGARVSGACSRVLDVLGAGAIVAEGLDVDIDANNSLFIYVPAAASVVVSDSNFRAASGAGLNRIFYSSHAGASFQVSGCAFGDTGIANYYYLPAVASLVSDYNCFDAESKNFNYNGATYSTVTLWKAAGYDTNSVVGGCAS